MMRISLIILLLTSASYLLRFRRKCRERGGAKLTRGDRFGESLPASVSTRWELGHATAPSPSARAIDGQEARLARLILTIRKPAAV